MKTLKRILMAFVLLAFSQVLYAQQRLAEGDCDDAQRNYPVYCDLTDKSDREVELLIEECKGGDLTGTVHGHEYVDLGLPSGTLWATCNIGASKPEDYGNYYAWGETSTKSTYDWSTYRYANGDSEKLTKYCNHSYSGNNGFTDNLTALQSGDDPATVNWGSGWRTPDYEQWGELLVNTTNEWTTRNGVNGRLFTSKKNGQTLFLPAAGLRSDRELNYAGSRGYYWSLLIDKAISRDACYLYINPYDTGGYCRLYGSRAYGRSVRPVRSSRQN